MRFSAPPPPTESSSSSLPDRTKIIIATSVSLVTLLIIASTGGLSKNDEPPTNDPSPIIILSAPHHDLFELCRREIIETPEGWKRCRSLCRHTGCCFLVDEASCLENNVDVCHLYAPCEEYYEYDDSQDGGSSTGSDEDDYDRPIEMPPAPGNIYDICSYKNIGTIDGFNECVNVCLHSECCTAMSSEENCREANREICDDYEPCDILNPVRTKIPTLHMEDNDDDVATADKQVGYLTDDDLKILINVACSPEEISSARQPCANLCQNKSCCITDSCDNDDCIGFENCTNLGKVLDDKTLEWSLTGISNDEEESASSEDDNDDDDFSVKSAVDSTCDEGKFNDPQAFKRCKNLCTSKMCCFLKHGDNCMDSPNDNCGDYDSCKFLLDYLDLDDTSTTADTNKDYELVKATCDKSFFSIPERFKDCKKVCKGHMCCFNDGETNCIDHPKKKCDVYEPCRSLYDILTKPDDSQSLDDTSVSSSDDVSLSDDTTLKPGAMVLSSSDDAPDSTTDSLSDTDTGASASNDVKNSDGADVQALIDATCDDGIFQSPNDFEDCEEMCELHMCCFKDGNGSCRDNREGKYDCSVYNSCQILIGGWRYTPGHGK